MLTVPARSTTTSREQPCNLEAAEWLKRKHDLFQPDRCPGLAEVNSRLEIILGAGKGEAPPQLKQVTKTCNPPTFSELATIKTELQELLPSLRGVQTLEMDERKAQGRLVRIDPSAQAIYVHPDIFKRGVAEGTVTLKSALFASAFAATLVGTPGQSVWATYHCLSWLIIQTSKEPGRHIGHLARSYASLESLGWDVKEPSAYWNETQRELRREHILGGLVGAPVGDFPFFSPHAEKSFAKQTKGKQFSDALMEKLRNVSGGSDADITQLLINYNIYSSRENPSFSRGFLIKGDQYIRLLFRRWGQDARELNELASEMLAEGELSVSMPMRAYVSKFSGESERVLGAVEKAHGVWPTKREESEIAKHPLGGSIDPDIKGLILHIHRFFRNAELADLLAFHPNRELAELGDFERNRKRDLTNTFRPTGDLDKAYQGIPQALRLLGREGFASLVASLNSDERVEAFAHINKMPTYHEDLTTPYREEAMLFEECFTGDLKKDLSSLVHEPGLIGLYLKHLIPPPKGVVGVKHHPTTSAYLKVLERFGFLVRNADDLIQGYGDTVRHRIGFSAMRALSESSDPLVHSQAYTTLANYELGMNLAPALQKALKELHDAPAMVPNRELFQRLSSAALLVAAKGSASDFETFMSLSASKRHEEAVADYLVTALAAGARMRGDSRPLEELIRSAPHSSVITGGVLAKLVESSAAQGLIDALSPGGVKRLVTLKELSPACRQTVRVLIGEERLRQILSTTDSAEGERALAGASQADLHALFGADEAAHAQKAVLVRKAYAESRRKAQRWVTDLFTSNRVLNYYAVLGLPFGANPDQVKFSYRLLAASFHSDRVSSAEDKVAADRALRDINEAYSVLSKDEKRALYDTMFLKNRFPLRPGFIPETPWYNVSLLRTLQLSPPAASRYTAQSAPRQAPKTGPQLLGPPGL